MAESRVWMYDKEIVSTHGEIFGKFSKYRCKMKATERDGVFWSLQKLNKSKDAS